MKRYVTNLSKVLQEAQVFYTHPMLPEDKYYLHRLIGNGSFGGCLDVFGMADRLYDVNRCFIWHKKHVEVGRKNTECRLQLLLLRYYFLLGGKKIVPGLENVSEYSQTTEYKTGEIVTKYLLSDNNTPLLRICLREFCSLASDTMMQAQFEVEPIAENVEIAVEAEMLDHVLSQRNVPLDCPVTVQSCGDEPVLVSHTSRGTAEMMLLSENQTAKRDGHTLRLTHSCNNTDKFFVQLLLTSSRDHIDAEKAYALCKGKQPAQHMEENRKVWDAFWKKSGIDTGSDEMNRIRVRFMYALRSSEGMHDSVPLSPAGLASNGLWPFPFEQDYNWMYESYFVSNHLEMAEATAHYWMTILDEVRRYTKECLGLAGTFVPWVNSLYSMAEVQRPPEDPPFSWQLHNGAYALHSCWLYWKYTHDDAYLHEILPLVRGTAEFYAGISTYDEHYGKYCIRQKPCMGQDERGGFNKDNYFCCLTSATWSIRTALEMLAAAGEEAEPLWKDIEEKGYAFELLCPTGLYASYEGGPAPNPLQKHPAQLNVLATLPLPEIYQSPAFRETYRRRYEISAKAEENHWPGWSLGTFLIASTRMRDPQECRRDYHMMLTSGQNGDDRQLDMYNMQMVESSGREYNATYFHTGMSMVMTAMSELFVQNFDGSCTVFPVVMTEKRVAFDHLLTPYYMELSGEIENGKAEILLHVTQNTAVPIRLGEACEGTYRLTDAAGQTVAETADRRFDAELKPGDYLIQQV